MELTSDIRMLKTKLPTYRNSEMMDRIHDRIHDETDREIMEYKLIDGYTLLKISDKLNIPHPLGLRRQTRLPRSLLKMPT